MTTGIVALLLLVSVSILLYLNLTFGWFVTNQSDHANGMQMSVQASSSLVITNNEALLPSITAQNQSSYLKYSWSDEAKKLIPTTHVYETDELTSASNLKYNTNPDAVSKDSGLRDLAPDANGVTQPELTFSPAVNPEGTHMFYIDYVVYIATTVEEVNAKSLVATMTLQDGITLTNAYKSASIDFYVIGESDETFAGTLNLAGQGKAADGSALSEQELTILENTVIPVAGTGRIAVRMRGYFDGALPDAAETGKTYVRSANLKTTKDFAFTVSFVANE